MTASTFLKGELGGAGVVNTDVMAGATTPTLCPLLGGGQKNKRITGDAGPESLSVVSYFQAAW